MLIYILIAFGFLGLALSIYLYKQAKFKKMQAEEAKYAPSAAFIQSMQEFSTEIEALNQSVRLLEGFVSDYFMTLNESGFRELCDIAEALASASALCNSLVSERNLDQASEVLKYVYDKKGKGAAPAILASRMPQSSVFLVAWKDKARTRVEVIENKLSQASQKFQEIGTVRKRTRNPTSVILGEVRKAVFGEAPKKAGSEKK